MSGVLGSVGVPDKSRYVMDDAHPHVIQGRPKATFITDILW